MTRTVGSRELKTRLGGWLQLVQEGTTLIVTDRGRPVAELRPLSTPVGEEAALLAEMALRGEISLPRRDWTGPSAVAYQGPSVADAIALDREDRF